jgi:phosphate:Na+ symporter
MLFNLFRLLGGAGLFIFGMKVMTASLEEALGGRLKHVLAVASRNQVIGVLVGTGVAFLVHSGAATVMVVNFVNAGLLELVKSIGLTIGANIGTTLSMQVVAFDLGKYCHLAIGLGFLLEMIGRQKTVKHVGRILIGFGVLFLGMETMKEAMTPYRDSALFRSVLASTDASTLVGMAWGIGVSTVITAILQSSGAMIGIIFALAGAGLATGFQFVFPLILGAHIGTCVVTMVGAVGANVNARRAAWSHLLFNLAGALVAALMYPLYARFIPAISGGGLVREIANTHTLVQFVNGVVCVLLAGPFVRLLRVVVPSAEPEEHGTWLADELISTPENAISAGVRELSRMLAIGRRMFRTMIAGFTRSDRTKFLAVEKDEDAVDKIKEAIDDYVVRLGSRQLSDRQSVMIQLISQAAADIERIGDHIESLIEISVMKTERGIWFGEKTTLDMVSLVNKADQILALAVVSLDPDHADFKDPGGKIREAIEDYSVLARTVQESMRERIENHAEQGIVGFFFMKYLTSFNKLVKHLRGIMHAESEEFFLIKADKLNQRSRRLSDGDLDTEGVVRF